jgi:hypothetical protein
MAAKKSEPDPVLEQREEEARHRREAGIEKLSEDEELISRELFTLLHSRLLMGADAARQAEPAQWAEDVSHFLDDSEEVELLLDEVATELPSVGRSKAGRSAPEVGAPPADSAEVAALERELLGAKSRDEVALLALRIARYYAQVAALFVVNRDVIAGLRGAGAGVEDRLEGIMLPTRGDSVIARSVDTAALARAEEPFGPVDKRLLRAMGRDGVANVVVLPVMIRRRVVNLLYVDNGADHMAETSISALHLLCSAISRAYERVILERKRAAG